jgi:hypothetical protein
VRRPRRQSACSYSHVGQAELSGQLAGQEQ